MMRRAWAIVVVLSWGSWQPVHGQGTGTSPGLLITEIADATLPGGLPKWVELTNCGGVTLQLSNYSLGNINNGARAMQFDAVVLRGTLAPGRSYVVSYENGDTAGDSAFFHVYGFDADNREPGAFINGDDVIVLFVGAALAGDPGDGSVSPVVDVYGVVGVDGTGEVWDYTDGWASRDPGSSPTPVFDPLQWQFGGANSLETGDGGEAVALMLALTDPKTHTCKVARDLVISEIADGTLPGGLPKWVELTNCGKPVDLSDYSIGIFSNGNATLSFDALVLSGELGEGESYVISYENGDEPGNSSFFDLYGLDADNLEPGSFINGDDAIALFVGAAPAGAPGHGANKPILDVYGVIGVDGTGEVWDYTDSYAHRLAGSPPTSVFAKNEWTFGGPNALETGDDEEEAQLMLKLTSPGTHNCWADIDGNGLVGVGDLLVLLGSWGPCGGSCPADLDQDRAVDGADLLLLIGAW